MSGRTKKITHRISSVTNGFVQAILPATMPDGGEQARVLAILGIDPTSLTCAYCGSPASHWDHLNSYVSNKRPSGFLNEARNRVPACGPCNTSKGGRNWREWMFGNARHSPANRQINGLAGRAERIDMLEAELSLAPHDLEAIVGKEDYAAYWEKLKQIEELMREAQTEAELLKLRITQNLDQSKLSE